MMIKINTLLSGAFSSFLGCAPYAATEETVSYDARQFQRVAASIDAGSITIMEGDSPSIRWINRGAPEKCRVTSSVLEDGTLSLISKSTQSGVPCEVDWMLGLPSSKPVKVDLGAGRLAVERYAGSLEANLGQGDLDIRAPLTELRVDAGQISGRVSNTNGKAEFNFGSGVLSYLWDLVPRSLQEVSFKVGSGHVTVEVPEGTPVNVNVDETPGIFGFGGFKAVSEFENNEAPVVKISGDGGSGRINVKKKR